MGVKEKWKNTLPLSCTTDEAVNLLISIARQTPCVQILYLFGSRVSGVEQHDSDIDFAFYTDKKFSWEDYYVLRSRLTSCLHTDRLNFVWLNKSDAVLIFEVIASGRVIYYSDADQLNDFELKAKKNFYDYRFYLEKHRHGI